MLQHFVQKLTRLFFVFLLSHFTQFSFKQPELLFVSGSALTCTDDSDEGNAFNVFFFLLLVGCVVDVAPLDAVRPRALSGVKQPTPEPFARSVFLTSVIRDNVLHFFFEE